MRISLLKIENRFEYLLIARDRCYLSLVLSSLNFDWRVILKSRAIYNQALSALTHMLEQRVSLKGPSI